MESLESMFEKTYSLETIGNITLENKDFILQGLLAVEVITHKRVWEAGYYYENLTPGENEGAMTSVKKFIDKIFSLEENLSGDAEYDRLVRHLPAEASLLKLDPEHYIIFEHSEINYDSKVRRVRLINREEFAAIKQTLLDQIQQKIQSMKNMIQIQEKNTEKLANL